MIASSTSIGFISNGRHAPSISRLFLQRRRDRLVRPPTASGSAYTHRCEALPHRRPGCPSTPRHLLLFSTDYSPTPQQNQLQPFSSSQSATPLPRFPISESFPSGASPSSTASLRSARRGQQTRVIGRGLYVESLTAGTHEVHGRTQGKFLLIKLKKKFPPPDSWDPPAVSSHRRKCLLVLRKQLFIPLTAGTHQIWWLTCGPTKRTCMQGFVNLMNK